MYDIYDNEEHYLGTITAQALETTTIRETLENANYILKEGYSYAY